MTTTAPATPKRTRQKGQDAQASDPKISPVRTRRSGIFLAAAIVLILAGGIGGAFAVNTASKSTQVFVFANDVVRGATIADGDITTIAIASGQTTTAIPVEDIDQVSGMKATQDIQAGALVSASLLAKELPAPNGKAVVGIALTPEQLPSQKLTAEDKVILVPIAGKGGIAIATAETEIPGVVSQVRTVPESGTTYVDVYVSAQVAAALTSQAAAGSIALYIAPESQG